ncbi:nudC domain-containing protein 3 [Euwallacea fornicatus]|uniref:nudC domain-containing protein 3 n=1 Tax=Euwallacea fornicatus TaxID=995702 RepID=UPI0033900490
MCESDPQVHDDMLFHMLSDCKTLPLFLDHIFGFLRRRTDFYIETSDSTSQLGMPKGFAQHLVRSAYVKWRPKQQDEIEILQENEIPQPIVEEEVFATEEVVSEEVIDSVDNMVIGTIVAPSAEPELTKSHNIMFSISEYYNGSILKNYCWTQSIGDVDVTVIIPENVRSKDLKVSISSQKVSITTLKGDSFFEGELCQTCKSNDVFWSLDKQKLQIHLDKVKERWWDCLLTSETRLDMSKLDCTRPFHELPETVQAKIEELSWNNERERLGLPTSEELAKQKLLQKAWNAEGCPFSGPFDPDQVSFK